MRTFGLVIALVLAATATAVAQKKTAGLKEFESSSPAEVTPEDVAAARRRAAGFEDIQRYGAQVEVPEKPFPWMAVGLALLIGLAAVPFGITMYKSTRKDLEAQATFGLQKGGAEGAEGAVPSAEKSPAEIGLSGISRRPAARRAAEKAAAEGKANEKPAPAASEQPSDITARDLVWDALSGAPNWVTAEWVASKAGMDAAQAADEIGALVEEGYVQQNKDRSGRAVFKVAS